jgi:CubicO group peptidase (beta-lactamase class C family)
VVIARLEPINARHALRRAVARTAGLLVCVAAGLATQLQATPQEAFTDAEPDGIKAFLRENFTETNAAMVLGLADEHSCRIFAAGTLDNGSDREVNGDTVFFIGSVSKTFTALLLQDAVERGEMKLEDPVGDYLPATVRMPTRNGKQIRLVDLATHSAGFPVNPDNMTGKDAREQYETYTVEKMYAYLSAFKLSRDPGTEYEYSNIGMALLGHVIALRARTNFEALVVNRICHPLGMDSTCIVPKTQIRGRLAIGHEATGKPSLPWNLQAYSPAGNIHSTANDLLKYALAQAGLSPGGLSRAMHKTHEFRFRDVRGLPDVPASLLGRTAMDWVDRNAYQPPGMELLGHAGGAGSYHAFVGFDKRQLRAVVVLSTANNLSCEAIGWTLLQRLPLKPENVHEFAREIVGLGFTFEPDTQAHAMRITRVFPDSPGTKAGLSAGMLIQRINDTSVVNKSVAENLALMAGPEGTRVRLQLFDPGRNATNQVDLRKGKFRTLSK